MKLQFQNVLIILLVISTLNCENSLSRANPYEIIEQQIQSEPPRTLGIPESSPTVPIFRLFKQYDARYIDTFYCSGNDEALKAVEDYGYTFQEIEGLIYREPQPGTVPFYRFFNPVGKDHFYSRSPETPDGYNYENIIGYVYTTYQSGTIPLYRLWNDHRKDHYYTTSQENVSEALSRGYQFEFTSCYILAYQPEGEVVRFQDRGLEQAIREEINKPFGDIYSSECLAITKLDASGRNITDLRGLEACENLKELDLSNNWISHLDYIKIQPLFKTHIEILDLSGNALNQFSQNNDPLYSLDESLLALDLRDNPITELINLGYYRNLQVLLIPDLTSLSRMMTFHNCENLFYAPLPDTLIEIPSGTFNNCFSLKIVRKPETYETPEDLAEVYESIFQWYIENAETINIPGYINVLPRSIERIGGGAFQSSGIETLDLSNTQVSAIEGYTFNGSKLRQIFLPQTLEIIGDRSFAHSNIRDLIIPESVINIGECAFITHDYIDYRLHMASDIAPKCSPEAFCWGTFTSQTTLYIPPGAQGYDVYPWRDFNRIELWIP